MVVGSPKDAELDKVTVEFGNGGEELVAYDEVAGAVVVGATVVDGSYSVTIKLTDDNKAGSLSTTYSIVINVSHKEPAQEA